MKMMGALFQRAKNFSAMDGGVINPSMQGWTRPERNFMHLLEELLIIAGNITKRRYNTNALFFLWKIERDRKPQCWNDWCDERTIFIVNLVVNVVCSTLRCYIATPRCEEMDEAIGHFFRGFVALSDVSWTFECLFNPISVSLQCTMMLFCIATSMFPESIPAIPVNRNMLSLTEGNSSFTGGKAPAPIQPAPSQVGPTSGCGAVKTGKGKATPRTSVEEVAISCTFNGNQSLADQFASLLLGGKTYGATRLNTITFTKLTHHWRKIVVSVATPVSTSRLDEKGRATKKTAVIEQRRTPYVKKFLHGFSLKAADNNIEVLQVLNMCGIFKRAQRLLTWVSFTHCTYNTCTKMTMTKDCLIKTAKETEEDGRKQIGPNVVASSVTYFCSMECYESWLKE